MYTLPDKLDQFLFVSSAKNKNEWYLPQGGIDEGEFVLDALFREIREELGILREEFGASHYLGVEDLDAEQVRADKRGFSKGKRYFFFTLFYIGSGTQFDVNQEEIDEYRWVMKSDISKLLSRTRPEKGLLILRWLSKL